MLYGSVAGDIIGSRFEMDSIKRRLNLPYDFDLFTKECSFTDDTVMIIALTDSIVNKIGWAENAKKYAQKHPKAGYGGMFVKWVQSSSPAPYNSFGNGSAMRVAAVGYAASSWKECMEDAKISAEITHSHPEGIKGAQAVAGAIYMARKKKFSKEKIKSVIEAKFGYDLNRKYDDIKKDYRFKVTCQDSVPESIISFLESSSWEDAVRKAVCLGGDTDTMACIAGGIAEAFYGDISEEVEQKVKSYLPKEMIETLDKFNEMEK